MDRVPAESEQKVVLQNGQRGHHHGKKNRAKQQYFFHPLMITALQMQGCPFKILVQGWNIFKNFVVHRRRRDDHPTCEDDPHAGVLH